MDQAASAPAETPLVAMRGVVKTFGSLVANDSIDIDIAPGEAHALLGENGAGKSTLVKMLYGLLQPTSGRILLARRADRPPRPQGRAAARHRHGVPALLAVRRDDRRRERRAGARRRRACIGPRGPARAGVARLWPAARAAAARCGACRSASASASRSCAASCRTRSCSFSTSPPRCSRRRRPIGLFETLERVRAEGRSVLYISHKLEEVRAICERATILRHGKVVAACDPRQESAAALARMMVGADVGAARRDASHATGPVRLGVRGAVDARARRARRRAEGHRPRGARRRDRRHRRRRRERTGRTLRGALGRAPRAAAGRRAARRRDCRAAPASTRAAGSARPSCRRSGSATRRRPRSA